jgi:tripartite-type tricarboxylate transporter receptor subunit TctC
MQKSSHRLTLAALGAFMAAQMAMPAGAQVADYPQKPIQIVVPFAAGGPLDLSTRIIARELQEAFKTPVTVHNQPGASGNLGGAAVAKAAPDGYTLLLTSDTALAANPALYGDKMNFNPATQLRPVTTTVSYGQMLVVHPTVTARDLKTFVQQAKAQEFTYASAGNGLPGHLSMEQFNFLTQTKMTHVPYRGTSHAVNDLLGGQVQTAFMSTPGVVQHVLAGKLRPIAVSSAERSPLAPEVPTMAEMGYPAATSEYFFYLMAPAKTPDATVTLLNSRVKAALSSDSMKAFLGKADMQGVGDSPEESAKRLADATARMTKLIQDRKILID